MSGKAKILFGFVFVLMVIFFRHQFVLFAYAQEANGVELSPLLIDEKVEPGDKLKYKLHFKNNLPNKVRMFAIVNDLSAQGDRQEFKNPHNLDKTRSVARWIRITRNNIEFMPGEEGDIDLQIIVNTRAVPGKYFASIAFPQGTNPKIAEASMEKKSFPEVRLNIEVKDLSVTKAQIKKFFAIQKIYFSSPVEFNLTLENIGTTSIKPRGAIFIYNRRGEEVDKIELKAQEDIKEIKSGEIVSEKLFWKKINNIGHLKARLELEYGQKEKRDLIDTVYFWYIPWSVLFIYGGGLFLLLIFLIIFLFKKTYRQKDLLLHRHLPKEKNETNGVLDLKNK